MREYKILLVDDDPSIIEAIGHSIESQGYQVVTVDSGASAIEKVSKSDYDLVITDLVMDETDGIEVLKKTKQLKPETMVIMLTGFGDMESAIDALRLGADDYLLKPCEDEEIYLRVKRCLEKLEFKRKIKLYEDILPICCECKKIRDDANREPGTGEWMSVEKFIGGKTKMVITSTYCPECAEIMQAKIDEKFPN